MPSAARATERGGALAIRARRRTRIMMVHRSTLRSLLLPFAVALAGACSAGCGSVWSVGSGEVAVVHTPTGVAPTPLQPGDYSLSPNDTVTPYTVRSQERAEQLDVLSADGERIVLDTSVRFHAIPGEVV